MRSLAVLSVLALAGLSLTSAHECSHHNNKKNSHSNKEHHHKKSHHHGEHHQKSSSGLRRFADNLVDYQQVPALTIDLNGRTCPQNASEYPQFSGEAPALNDKDYWAFRNSRSFSFEQEPTGGITAFDTFKKVDNGTDDQIDVVATRLAVSNFASPVVGLAYFDQKSKYNFSYDSTLSDVSAVLAVGDYSSASVVLFKSVIEYDDIDGDKEFNITNDLIVSQIALDAFDWDHICESPDNDSGLKVYNATTLPNDTSLFTFSLQSAATNATGLLDGWILTPRQIKWALEINNYPFTANATRDTRLAVETYVLTASANNSANWNVSWSDALTSYGITSIIGTDNNNTDADIYVNWKSTAQVANITQDGNQTKVENSEVNVMATHFVPSAKPTDVSAHLFFGWEQFESVKVQVVHYSFDAIKPSKVRFDQATLGAGKDANEASNAFSSRTVAIAVGVIVLLAGIGGISYFGYRYYTERKRRESALLDDDHAYQRLPNQA